jgi:hypothetical protein
VKKVILVVVLMLISGMGVAAEGVPITPGMWEMTMTMKMSMMEKTQTKTQMECIEEEEFDPHNFNMEQKNPCDIDQVKIDGNTVSWAVSCPSPTGSMTGSWLFTSNGDSVTGTGEMAAKMGAMSFDMNMDWVGKRVGDCD